MDAFTEVGFADFRTLNLKAFNRDGIAVAVNRDPGCADVPKYAVGQSNGSAGSVTCIPTF